MVKVCCIHFNQCAYIDPCISDRMVVASKWAKWAISVKSIIKVGCSEEDHEFEEDKDEDLDCDADEYEDLADCE
jgi:hypothetical protein